MNYKMILKEGKISRLVSDKGEAGWSGEVNLIVYNGKKYVLRRCADVKRAKHYQKISRELEKHGFLPKLLYRIGKDVIYEYIEGRDLKKKESLKVIRQIGVICAHINKIKRRGNFDRRFKKHLSIVAKAKNPLISKTEIKEVLRIYFNLKRKLKPLTRLDGNDLNHENFRLKKGKVYFVDVEAISPRIELFGTGKAFLKWFTDKMEQQVFMKGYTSVKSASFFTEDYRDLVDLAYLTQELAYSHIYGKKFKPRYKTRVEELKRLLKKYRNLTKMTTLEQKISDYIINIPPHKLGLNKIPDNIKVLKLGMGASNLNYLIIIGKNRFVCRINAHIGDRKKSSREFEALKMVASLKIGSKTYILEKNRKILGETFIIIEYIEGQTLDKVKYKINKIINKLSELCAKIHKIPLSSRIKSSLKKEEYNYQSYLEAIKVRMIYIKKHINNKEVINMINDTYNSLKERSLPDKDKHPLVITQGDMCEQNIIINKNKMRLIDFESLGLTDPAAELAHIFIDFGKPFSHNQKEIFIKNYLKIRKDNHLKKRIEAFIPLKYFIRFLWALEHIIKIKNKEMHQNFIEKQDIQKHIDYAQRCLNEAVNAKVISPHYKNIKIGHYLS